MGFSLNAIWDESSDSLESYFLPDLGGGTSGSTAYVTIQLATLDFFSMSDTDAGYEDEYCSMYATFEYESADLTAEPFDYTAGTGGTGEAVELFAAYEGNLSIYLVDSRCYDWTDRDPVETFDGTHIGFGFGALTDSLTTLLEEAYEDEWPEYESGYITQFVAVNHPSETEELGYDFVAYDWNTALFVGAAPDECETFLDSSGVSTEICGAVRIDERDGSFYYDLVDYTESEGSRYAFIRGNSYWYEDFPNLDLDIMAEGTP